ncbi:hypothetical protein BZA70DRAFT_273761 [Myxozyma melibiosi]|uniref:Bud emergence protein 1 n=1 Tax=Myxozyma melibiosi TaxID=54550 RepID=A0ABR1FF32_9ASCO
MIKGIRRSLKGEKTSPYSSNSRQSAVKTPTTAATILPPKKVIRAIHDYTANAPGELSFSKGDFFHVVGNEDNPDWYEASNPSANSRGMVPVSYFEVLGRNVRESSDGSLRNGRMSSGVSESSSATQPGVMSPTTRRESDRMSSASSTSSGRRHYQPLYGVVQFDFAAERPDELHASQGDAVIIVAQSNHEWFVAKPIGRLGGPGLIPISFVEIRDMATGRPIENVNEAILRAGVPKVEEWKKKTAEYKASSIPLGKFEDDSGLPYNRFQQMSLSHNSQSTLGQHSIQSRQIPGTMQSYSTQSYISHQSGPYGERLSQSASEISYEPVIVSASVDQFSFDNGRYWYLLIAEMEDGTFRNLCRYYEDFYDFQIRLLDEFPDEAGRTGRQRILPFIPGPVTYVNDSISSQRRVNLDEYVRKLVALPPYISRSSLVKGLFALREGDVESTQPASSMPQPDQQSLQFDKTRQSSGYAAHTSTVNSSTATLDQQNAYRQSIDPTRSASGASRTNGNGRVHTSQSNHSGSPTSSVVGGEGYAHSTTGSIAGGRDVEMERNMSTMSTMSSATTSRIGNGFIKVKIFYQEDLIAIRVPADISYEQLENKIQERLGSSNLLFYYQDEYTGQHTQLRDDAGLAAAIGNGSKLVLYAQ